MRLFLFALAALSAAAANSADQTESRILPAGRIPGDGRLGSPRTLDSYHPWIPPASAGEWEKRKEFLVTQVLASQGLFPLPPRTPLNAVVHGRIDRPEYTVEKVLLNTRPGHYLAGSLFRPKGIPAGARIPAVLCPHGHWANGRFYDAGEGGAAAEIKGGGESYSPNARHVVQTIPATLARQGIIAFAYDMIGNADSAPLGHPQSSVGRFNGGMEDAGSLLRLDSFMGLQTWNSIRALDWIETLPDVDPKRIGVTGGSGGGTQTFMLCAVDPRPAAAFPAVMVSTGMQGGCVCENAPLLRVGTGNIELAALFSPKPLGMTACDDWTVEIETKGLPELKQHYAMLGHPQLVDAWFFPQFKHNYNQNTRQLMNEFFNLHLQGKKGRVVEKPIVPCTNEELSVFDSSHPWPKDFLTIPELKPVLAKEAQSRLAEILPTG
ncbi:MAG TPA: alpha/beta hydrolase family protein, partial [Planctomycetia bacterium]|nr:alpha/beta hydrolase family protein [Planctomycetia bacterium]